MSQDIPVKYREESYLETIIYVNNKREWDLMTVRQFITFDEFVTPGLITIVYILGVIAIILISLGMLAMVFLAGSIALPGYEGADSSLHFEYAIGAVLLFIFGNLYWRVTCELLMVLFKINNHLSSIDAYFIAINKNP